MELLNYFTPDEYFHRALTFLNDMISATEKVDIDIESIALMAELLHYRRMLEEEALSQAQTRLSENKIPLPQLQIEYRDAEDQQNDEPHTQGPEKTIYADPDWSLDRDTPSEETPEHSK